MPKSRQISVSTVAYDGYPIETAFESLSKLGVGLVEPAYIQGYMAFTEDDFKAAAIRAMAARLKAQALKSVAISAHMDLGADDAPAMLARRLRFTAGIGALYTITNSATADKRDALLRAIEANIPLAEKLGVVIALENPGHGRTNLLNSARTGVEVIRSFGSRHVCMNYDTANALTCLEGENPPEQDIDFALPVSRHMHLKDVVRYKDQWRYVAIGSGDINYDLLLSKLATRPDIPLTLELPLRLIRRFNHDPTRHPEPVAITEIEATISQSWRRCAATFADMPELETR